MKRKRNDVEAATDNENWALIVRPDEHQLLKACVSKHLDMKPLKIIAEILSPEKKKLFKETCFGFLLELPEFHIQTQLIHNLLLRELKQPIPNEMWFDIAGTRLRFSIREFSLITGLNSRGSLAMSYDATKKKRDGLYERFFNKISKTYSVNKQTVGEVFCQNAGAANDEDAVKLAVLYVIECFILSGQSTNVVNRTTIDFIDYGDYNAYAWGKNAYATTIASMKKRMAEGLSKNNDGAKGKWNYRLYGFPYALQIWFYECCKGAKNFFSDCVFREGDHCPRMLSWRSTPFLGRKGRFTIMFNDDEQSLKPSNLSPTLNETIQLGIDHFSVELEDHPKDSETCRASARAMKIQLVNNCLDRYTVVLEKMYGAILEAVPVGKQRDGGEKSLHLSNLSPKLYEMIQLGIDSFSLELEGGSEFDGSCCDRTCSAAMSEKFHKCSTMSKKLFGAILEAVSVGQKRRDGDERSLSNLSPTLSEKIRLGINDFCDDSEDGAEFDDSGRAVEIQLCPAFKNLIEILNKYITMSKMFVGVLLVTAFVRN
ncbi:uncharacterized protein LOC126687099 isoform X2 [Mercurialis annua]|uniref:uncharacterized protein LOC126687099 isoform X2 n=1 Tax=Mercurialis annua TaxID=3986 RepID=UPI00215E8FEF|nr:uncharacterized protein LOC126687099 isoform X2 [Mercurialis annua]